MVEETSPGGQGSECLTVGADLVPVELTEAGVDVNVLGSQERLTLPDPSEDPEAQDNGSSEELLEETLRSAHTLDIGASNNGSVELKAGRSARCFWGDKRYTRGSFLPEP